MAKTEQNSAMASRFSALNTTDLSPLIRLSDLLVPRVLGALLPKLDERQRAAFDKVMPVGGQKKFYIQLVGTPTPPIVIQMAYPPVLSVVPEAEVSTLGIKGLRLTIEELQALSERKIGKSLRGLKGQTGALMSISAMFAPFMQLGPGELRDLRDRAKAHFKPALDLLPR